MCAQGVCSLFRERASWELGESSLQMHRCSKTKNWKHVQLYHGAGYIMSDLHLFLGLAELANALLSISSIRYVTQYPDFV